MIDDSTITEFMEKVKKLVEERKNRDEINTKCNIPKRKKKLNCSNYNIKNTDFNLVSSPNILSKIACKVRKFINTEVRNYVDPSLDNQSKVNFELCKSIVELEGRVCFLENITDMINVRENLGSDKKNAPISDGLIENNFNLCISTQSSLIRIIENTIDLNNSQHHIAEYGLSDGFISIYLSKNYDSEIYGIDDSIEYITKCYCTNENLCGSVKYLLADNNTLNLIKSGYFDIIFSIGVLNNLSRIESYNLLNTLLRISKKVLFLVSLEGDPCSSFSERRLNSIEDWNEVLNDLICCKEYLSYDDDNTHIIGIISNIGII
ncbi:class I SAM-dependent methyltransferase [Methanospirillum lacunae]|uniref:Methyltransferase type 11 domain-containing protein n=1 Tax=Methanospirillum lacunae TaxID=668570 RepID=A0A2V2N0R1_9EURY|nr:class I SAM-dependent methyltransferase [Methanospirillum lacunae]PWR71226.1 hypothetical protein DK846_10175 [Methanospirillum lacunae]